MSLSLTECYAYHYAHAPEEGPSAAFAGQQKLKAGHKLVLAFASLGGIGHIEGSAFARHSAAAYFTDYVQDGVKVPAGGPIVIEAKKGDAPLGVTELLWKVQFDNSYGRGSVVILAFD